MSDKQIILLIINIALSITGIVCSAIALGIALGRQSSNKKKWQKTTIKKSKRQLHYTKHVDCQIHTVEKQT